MLDSKVNGVSSLKVGLDEIRDVPYDGRFGGGTDDGVDCDHFKGVTDVVKEINDSAMSFNASGTRVLYGLIGEIVPGRNRLDRHGDTTIGGALKGAVGCRLSYWYDLPSDRRQVHSDQWVRDESVYTGGRCRVTQKEPIGLGGALEEEEENCSA
eukprot:scaffold34473_cov72-Attheya_sp.AAC.1